MKAFAVPLALLVLLQARDPTRAVQDSDAELSRARRRWSAAHAKEGMAKDLALERALAAYRAVARDFPSEIHVVAEAHFRRGEILRAARRPDEALEAFAEAAACGPRTAFHARALLEIGHVHRRAGRLDRALDLYVSVHTDPRAPPRSRDSAALWAGTAWAAGGRTEEARRVWSLLARRAERPVIRVEAFDRLALMHCETGNTEESWAVLARCTAEVERFASEYSELGKSVRSALRRMRVRSCLGRLASENAKEPTHAIR